jgi:hypothetical protein
LAELAVVSYGGFFSVCNSMTARLAEIITAEVEQAYASIGLALARRRNNT